MKTLLYFHGLGSSAASRKFVLLQQDFDNKYQVCCPECTFTTDLQLMFANLFMQYENGKLIVLICRSTGGNFVYHLASKLRSKSVRVNLILINPLLTFFAYACILY